jgi:uncharacterized protein with HEPN domain
MPSERPAQRLTDIIENIDRIRSHVRTLTYDTYIVTPLVQDAVERCFARISEAAVKLGDQMDVRYANVPWVDIRSFGNRLRHAYDDIDDRILWSAVQHDLQPLREACETELAALERGLAFER